MQPYCFDHLLLSKVGILEYWNNGMMVQKLPNRFWIKPIIPFFHHSTIPVNPVRNSSGALNPA
jgi:hypothetical protein